MVDMEDQQHAISVCDPVCCRVTYYDKQSCNQHDELK